MNKMREQALKRFAKEGLKEHGIKIFMKDMTLLETGEGDGLLFITRNGSMMYISYVMIEDRESGKQYQIYGGAKYYTSENHSLYEVREYEYID